VKYNLDQLNKSQRAISKVIGTKMKESKGQDPCEVCH
jgi:hypothetical protein